MKKSIFLLTILLILGAVTALAQDSPEKMEQAQQKLRVEKILGVLKLPEEARKAREAGIPEEDVRKVMEEARKSDLTPDETGNLLKESSRAVKENGKIENFGSFVKERLRQGMRGRELSEAIQKEHQLRGQGKGKGGKGSAKGEEQGKGHTNRNQVHGDDGQMNQEQNKETEGKTKGQGGKKGGKSNGKQK